MKLPRIVITRQAEATLSGELFQEVTVLGIARILKKVPDLSSVRTSRAHG